MQRVISMAVFLLVVTGLGADCVQDGPPAIDDPAQKSADPAPLVLGTWEELEQTLSQELREGDCQCDSLAGMERCRTFSRVLSLDSRDVFFEMINLQDKPLVTLWGFLAIKKEFPEDALRAAVTILARSKPPSLSLYVPVLLEISEHKKPDTTHWVLDHLASLPSVDLDSFTVIRMCLDCKGCYDWFHDPRRRACSTSLEAAVFDSILEYCRKQGGITDLMRRRLAWYAKVPGYPRYIYAYTGESRDEGFRSALISALEGVDYADSPRLLVHRRREYIKQYIDLSSLKLTPERRSIIEKELARQQ